MSSFPYRNAEYRDELIKFSYPFDERSVLEDGDVYVGTDLLLDAVLFFKQAVELPVRIGRVDGSVGAHGDFQLVLYDASGVSVATCLVSGGGTRFDVLNEDGVFVGNLLFEETGLQRFSATVNGRATDLQSDVAVFSLDVTHVARSTFARYVACPAGAAHGAVRLVARHGCRFVNDGGVVHLDVLSDDTADGYEYPLISVNGVTAPSIWLTNHPECNVRVTTINGGIRFEGVSDNTQ